MQRLLRLRRTEAIRRLLAETRLDPARIVPAYFVVEGVDIREERPSRSGLLRISTDQLGAELRRAKEGGAAAVMLFGVPNQRPADATMFAPFAAALATARELDLVSMVDVCRCSWSADGHCVIHGPRGIDEGATTADLVAMARALAALGADVVCPSDMSDGRIGAIRRALDDDGAHHVLLMAYAAKLASAFYGPFRLAAESTPSHGDRRAYQLPPENRREALREVAADVAEGADLLMVKPAIHALDLVRDCRERFDLPIVAYHVSGEYRMLRAAADAGDLDFPRAARETLLAIHRAGADLVVSYLAPALWSGEVRP